MDLATIFCQKWSVLINLWIEIIVTPDAFRIDEVQENVEFIIYKNISKRRNTRNEIERLSSGIRALNLKGNNLDNFLAWNRVFLVYKFLIQGQKWA